MSGMRETGSDRLYFAVLVALAPEVLRLDNPKHTPTFVAHLAAEFVEAAKRERSRRFTTPRARRVPDEEESD